MHPVDLLASLWSGTRRYRLRVTVDDQGWLVVTRQRLKGSAAAPELVGTTMEIVRTTDVLVAYLAAQNAVTRITSGLVREIAPPPHGPEAFVDAIEATLATMNHIKAASKRLAAMAEA